MIKKKGRGARFDRERALDVVKFILIWAAMTVFFFAYWMLTLLVASLLLLNVWHTSIEAIVKYAAVLTAASSIIYGARKIYGAR